MENYNCIKCKYYLGDLSCHAFDSIPDEILNGKNDHLKPLKDQSNNIFFEPKQDNERNKYYIEPDLSDNG